jgi:hypothetical protein
MFAVSHLVGFGVRVPVLTGYGSDVTSGATVTALLGSYTNLSNLVDDNTANAVSHNDTTIPAKLKVALTATKQVEQIKLTSSSGNPQRMPTTLKLYGSATGSFAGEEATLLNQSGITWAGSQETKTYQFTNATTYQYYAIECTVSQSGSKFEPAELEMMEGVYD